jgi:chemotaxis-related protein WspD
MSSFVPSDSCPGATQVQGTDSRLRASDCWNSLGVFGAGSCPELKKFTHCRNCPVYSRAGVALLDRPLPAEYRKEWTRHFAAEQKQQPPTRMSVVLFRVELEWLALPTHLFQEVAENRLVHSLPHRRNKIVLGIANVRGELLITVALDRLLGTETNDLNQQARASYKRLLVANWDDARIAFPVDEVPGMHRLQSHELKDAPATVAKSKHRFTQAIFLWEDKVVGLLDAPLLFSTLNRNLS